MGNTSCQRKLIDFKKAYSQRYEQALEQTPAPGGGGCHTHLLKIGNCGARAGIDPQTMFEDIRRHIPKGTRRVSDREIQDAINKALSDFNEKTFTPRDRPVSIVKDGAAALRGIINQSRIKDETDLISPLHLYGEPKKDVCLFLTTLYKKTDKLWIGERYEPGKLKINIRTIDEWITYFQNNGKTSPLIIINSLTGKTAPKEDSSGPTYRGNNNVVEYRYCLVEFDGLSRENQIKFWGAVKLPIVALIDSGGKSIHAWLDVQKLAPVSTSEEWEKNIKNKLYDRLLAPLGVDGACSNPARLSRLPGHFREEKGKYQRLLWLSPEGRPICQ